MTEKAPVLIARVLASTQGMYLHEIRAGILGCGAYQSYRTLSDKCPII